MNFLNFDASSLASLGENITRDIGAGFEQLKKGVEETLREQDDQDVPEDENDHEEEWSFGAIDSLVKTLVGDGPAEQGGRDKDTGAEDPRVAKTLEDGMGESTTHRGTTDGAVATGTTQGEEPSGLAGKEDDVKVDASHVGDDSPVPDAPIDSTARETAASRRKARRKPKKANHAAMMDEASPASKTDEGRNTKRGTSEPESSGSGSVSVEASPACPSEPASSSLPAPTVAREKDQSLPQTGTNSKDTTEREASLQERIRDLEDKVSRQAKELAMVKKRAVREREEKQEMEARLKSKSAEILEVMREGEVLSKRQLAMETTIKQLKVQLAESQRNLTERESALQAEKRRGDEEASFKAERESRISLMKSEHEETVKMLRAELVATERKLSTLSKDGSSEARKLQEAQNKASALQDSLEEVREEMSRQRVSADEREEMLQSEIVALQRRCSEAEARQKDSESKLPEATAPLLAQVDSLQKKLEDQDRISMAAQKRLVDKVEELEKTVEALRREKRELADQAEEATSRNEGVYSQLSSAQNKARDAERLASEERLARQNAEASLSMVQAELSSIESTFTARIDALTGTEALLKKTIRELEEELIQERQQQGATDRQESIAAVSSEAGADLPSMDENGPGAGGEPSRSQLTVSPTRLFAADSSENTLRRKIRELEETRDRLSSALVKAEQRAASGDSARKELADVRQKLEAASEVIGEKEETIDELRADLADIKDILASQQDQLATAVSRSMSATD